ncbi:hypothetical protein GW15_0218770 [Xanthomonas axonopodis pv. vasculorum]|uniref:Uncharacterized protein n=1 Tax=Xanthomonas axonopodis pv. vasculorum TaxID=325777 RepID=A0A098PUB3_9XANT|nr:hypothetical protein GW15_0218770 [Xanthomonas axonopodis pv. vasculorum]
MKGAGGRRWRVGAAEDRSGARVGRPYSASSVLSVAEPTAGLVRAVDAASRALFGRYAGCAAKAFFQGAAARAVATPRRIARRSRG